MHLVEEHSVVDPTFIEDFLLTYRTFLSSPMEVGKKLLEWFNDPSLRDKVKIPWFTYLLPFALKYNLLKIMYVLERMTKLNKTQIAGDIF